jgi:hypothetical protein
VLCDAELLIHLGNGFALALQDLSCTQFAGVRCGSVSLIRDDSVLRSAENSNSKSGPVFSYRVSLGCITTLHIIRRNGAVSALDKSMKPLFKDRHSYN